MTRNESPQNANKSNTPRSTQSHVCQT